MFQYKFKSKNSRGDLKVKKFHKAASLLIAFSLILTTCFVQGLTAKAEDSTQMCAYIDSDNSLTVYLGSKITLTGQNSDGFSVYDENNQPVQITSVVDSNTGGTNVSTNLVKINVGSALDITSKYTVKNSSFTTSNAVVRNVLNEDKYYYGGNDLGDVYSQGSTSFCLWAPTAQNISILLFDTAGAASPSNTYAMSKAENGTWKASISGDLNGKYYQYKITLYVNGNLTTYNVDDPYSYGSSANCGKSLIYDSTQTNPAGWSNDKYVTLKNNVDAIIYEMHVRDYTISSTSGVKQEYMGKYLGLAETGTKSAEGESTGLDNIKDLGVTHVELMPTYDYGTGDETESNTNYDWYNWGYDPVLYNTPEGSYATNPNGTARQSEYKQMVQAFHNNGIGVVADSVYNHTYQTGGSQFSIFDKIVPGYYYRINDDGTYSNGSSCNDDIASERPMVRKFIVDSVKYWVSQYHVDGIRFDIMGLIDKQTMEEALSAAKAINPNFIGYGEGWGNSTDRMTQVSVPGSGLASFNDGIRDNTNNFAENTNMPALDEFIKDIKGQLMSRSIALTTPNETVNYATCHDDLNLWDRISAYTNVSNSDKLKMDALTNTIIMTSQGIPFFAEGDEFGRSKNGNYNSYNDNDANVNPINWTLKSQNKSLYNYYKGLVELRKAHPAFRMTDNSMIDKDMVFDTTTGDSQFVEYAIQNNANSDSWKNIYVAYNGGSSDRKVTLNGTWTVVVNGKNAGVDSLGTVKDEVTVPAYSSVIMYNNDLSSISLPFKSETNSNRNNNSGTSGNTQINTNNQTSGSVTSTSAAAAQVNNPKTGTDVPFGALITLTAASGIVLLTLCRKKKY